MHRPHEWLMLAASVAALAAPTRDDQELKPPKAGEIAPGFHYVEWLQLDGPQPEVEKLRGQVLVITTYGHYCDSCVRVGVPTANSIRVSNPAGLKVISITSSFGPEEENQSILEKAKELGIQHSIAKGSYFGDWTPYLNLNVSSNLTWAFVVTRTGGVLWQGDPSQSREDYLAAITRAIAAPPAEALPSSMAPELAEALRAYVSSEFDASESAAQSVLKKLGSKSGASVEQARNDANALLALIAATRSKITDELEQAAQSKEPERFERALFHARQVFPKGKLAERANQLESDLSSADDTGPSFRAWAKWIALEHEKPANFPAEKDKATSKYAKQLEKLASDPAAPGGAKARAWLESFAQAKPTK